MRLRMRRGAGRTKQRRGRHKTERRTTTAQSATADVYVLAKASTACFSLFSIRNNPGGHAKNKMTYNGCKSTNEIANVNGPPT